MIVSSVVIAAVALAISALTFFSGFGLGTLMMPVFACFFPVQVAIAATAVVHLANNIFKVILVGKKANFGIVLRFAVPAALCAALGAWLLYKMGTAEPLVQYQIGRRSFEITVVKLVIAVLIAVFGTLELSGKLKELKISGKYIPLGGMLSGFFGGLSGHQGALRSAFLVRTGLEKEPFIGTVAVCAVVVDVTRLVIYGITFFARHFEKLENRDGLQLLIVGSLAAFIGTFIGSRVLKLKKVSMKHIRRFVGIMLILLAIAIGSGLA